MKRFVKQRVSSVCMLVTLTVVQLWWLKKKIIVINFHFILKAFSVLSVLISDFCTAFLERDALHISFLSVCYFQASLQEVFDLMCYPNRYSSDLHCVQFFMSCFFYK